MQASPSPPETSVDISHRNHLYPVLFADNADPVTCSNCGYVNNCKNNFCTHCGYPTKPNDERLATYNYRQQRHQELLNDCRHIIMQARGTIYIMSVICLTAIAFVFTADDVSYLRAVVLVFLSALYFLLARWSVSKPFTALLISFLMVVSFMAINTWAQFRQMFTTGAGLLLAAVQFVLFYFIFRGVKAAYMADVLEEEEKL